MLVQEEAQLEKEHQERLAALLLKQEQDREREAAKEKIMAAALQPSSFDRKQVQCFCVRNCDFLSTHP